jgi:hypothetical protein
MQDLQDLGNASLYPESLRHNAMTGKLTISRFDPATWSRVRDEVDPPSTWVVDMLTRQRGYGLVTDSKFDMRLTSVGALPPPAPEDQRYKPTVGMLMWSETYGLAQWISCGSIAVRTIGVFWDECRTFTEASDGLLPVITIDHPRRVTIGHGPQQREFLAPVIEITDWVLRESIPVLAARPATVEPPPRLHLQIPHKPAKRIARKPKGPGDDLDDLLNDEIPL